MLSCVEKLRVDHALESFLKPHGNLMETSIHVVQDTKLDCDHYTECTWCTSSSTSQGSCYPIASKHYLPSSRSCGVSVVGVRVRSSNLNQDGPVFSVIVTGMHDILLTDCVCPSLAI